MLHVWDLNQRAEAAQKRAADGGLPHPYHERGYAPPPPNELASIPWSGEGDDPLEDLYAGPAFGEEG